ncbi:hypothetical protein [Acinetobacter junii]|uniref:hypothetical protein n=1 Tax=Acinetobacter junii TaxID=40215 RepID=UPI001F3B64BA|nr:hypothetical protein [Acinetobacter junii]
MKFVVYREKNEKYIVKILQQDTGLHEKYGDIENFKLRKSGWYSGDSQEPTPYYYYHFYIAGSLKDGVIELIILPEPRKICSKIYKIKKILIHKINSL